MIINSLEFRNIKSYGNKVQRLVFDEEGGLKNNMYSCDEINREITLTIVEQPTLITGKEYSNEEEFLKYVQSLVIKYQTMLNE